ncbi:MAG: hypothetical protein A3G76_05785 [Acidobacteria bacterium RIFCSPLOWO2_12_FULL_65_11]|nr:MAG: hypothetical protein A3H95_02935 [Acidobacteria bacterium RIFCSPLOWO2_02_FULL_64_15]OFW29392.1 MAG: hypothetical protein A3G76_05785 [Acidobacteria bacterium RIFCSPLOWO2_12_FULL_65_11]
MKPHRVLLRSERGFSIVETLIAVSLLTVCVLGAAGVLGVGLQLVSSSPGDLTATQKAAEAIESVFAARDSHVLTWAQIRNVAGASGQDGGIFLDGPQPLRLAGTDALVNTTDDAAQPIESVELPGPDQNLLTPFDNQTVTLDGYTREIQIRDIQPNLRSITVEITFQWGGATRRYTLVTYVSNFA